MAEHHTGSSARQFDDLLPQRVRDAAVRATTRDKRPWWKWRWVVMAGVITLVVAAPLLTLDAELFFLNLIGLGAGWQLLRRFMRQRMVRRFQR